MHFSREDLRSYLKWLSEVRLEEEEDAARAASEANADAGSEDSDSGQ